MKEFFRRIIFLGLRKKKRYKLRSAVFVKLQNAIHGNQIDEISLGGLSFFYNDTGYPVGRSSRTLSLLADCCGVVDRIPFRIVSDTSTGESILPQCRVKRMSVKFDRLSLHQKRLLKDIIQHHKLEATFQEAP